MSKIKDISTQIMYGIGMVTFCVGILFANFYLNSWWTAFKVGFWNG